MLLLTGPVEAVQGYADTGDGLGNVPVLNLQQADLDSMTAPPAMDVPGMTLSTPLAGFEAAARAQLPQAVTYRTKVAGKGLFGQATGILDPARHEALGAVHGGDDGQTVLAIMRWLEFDPADVTLEGIKASLVKKYGPNLTEYRPGQWSWGALSPAEDPEGFCGGASTLAPGNDRDLPQMVAGSPPGTAAPDPAPVWHAPGWPAMVISDRPGVIPELARCGPVITAIAVPGDGKIVLKLWLKDRKLAGPATITAAPTPELARPKVKF